jgi:hypothetical protein
VTFLGPYLTACALLVVAGVTKVVRPADTATSLAAAMAVPRQRAQDMVRVGAFVEAVLGLVAISRPSVVAAAAVAASYFAFTVYVLWLRRTKGALASCGCFGSPDTVPTSAHILVNLGLTIAASAVAATADGTGIVALLDAQPWAGLPLVLTSAAGAVLAFGVLSHLARVEGARRLFLAQP